VTTASSVAEALQLLQRKPPHVLVCDIAMPGEDGYTLIRRIRAGEGDPALPAVAVTAFARREDATAPSMLASICTCRSRSTRPSW